MRRENMNSEIVNYLREGLRRGFSLNLLKQKLREGGFDDQETDFGNEQDVKKIDSLPVPKEDDEEKFLEDETSDEEIRGKAFVEQSLKKFSPEEKSFFEEQPYKEINLERKIRRPRLFEKIWMTFAHPEEIFESTKPE